MCICVYLSIYVFMLFALLIPKTYATFIYLYYLFINN